MNYGGAKLAALAVLLAMTAVPSVLMGAGIREGRKRTDKKAPKVKKEKNKAEHQR